MEHGIQQLEQIDNANPFWDPPKWVETEGSSPPPHRTSKVHPLLDSSAINPTLEGLRLAPKCADIDMKKPR